MAGREEMGRGPCPCGGGEIVVTRCTPDHGWPSNNVWWECELNCERCQKEFTIFSESDDPRPKVVRRTDFEEHKRREDAWHLKRQSIMETDRVTAVIQQLASRLEQEKP